MERRRPGAARIVAKAGARGAAAAGLSGVARGSERKGGNTAARRDQRPDDPAAACGDATHRREVCADAGPHPGDFRFRGGVAGASRVVQRGGPASPVREPLTRTEHLRTSNELVNDTTPSRTLRAPSGYSRAGATARSTSFR